MDEIYAKTSSPVPLVSLSSAPVSVLGGMLFIPNMKRYNRLRQQDIGYVKGDKSYVTLYLTNGQKQSVSTHLGNFMRYLDVDWFVQTSRSHIVNLHHIEAVTTRSVVVLDKVIPLTETYRAGLWDRLPIVRLKSD